MFMLIIHMHTFLHLMNFLRIMASHQSRVFNEKYERMQEVQRRKKERKRRGKRRSVHFVLNPNWCNCLAVARWSSHFLLLGVVVVFSAPALGLVCSAWGWEQACVELDSHHKLPKGCPNQGSRQFHHTHKQALELAEGGNFYFYQVELCQLKLEEQKFEIQYFKQMQVINRMHISYATLFEFFIWQISLFDFLVFTVTLLELHSSLYIYNHGQNYWLIVLHFLLITYT